MPCPTCQTLNRQDARFCKECGTFLAPLCPQCRRELPDNAKFCDACGFALTSQAPAPNIPLAPSQNRAPRAASSPPPTAARVSQTDAAATAEQTKLAQYIPKELLKKLNAAVVGGGLSGERRIVTM